MQLSFGEEILHGLWLVALPLHEHLHQVLLGGVGLGGSFLRPFVHFTSRTLGLVLEPVGDLWPSGFLAF